MPHFRVHVADKNTGAETTLLIEAPDGPRAHAAAISKGWLVGSVEPAPESGAAKGRSSFARVLVIAGLLVLALAAWGFPKMLRAAGETGLFLERPGSRFASDNAIGATANAAERLGIQLAEQQEAIVGAIFLSAAAIIAAGRR